jgi:polyribonucleotide 5'-hydroxyl-kinase
MRDRQLHSYFYGGPALSHGVLAPHSITVGFDYLTIFRIGEGAFDLYDLLPMS